MASAHRHGKCIALSFEYKIKLYTKQDLGYKDFLTLFLDETFICFRWRIVLSCRTVIVTDVQLQ